MFPKPPQFKGWTIERWVEKEGEVLRQENYKARPEEMKKLVEEIEEAIKSKRKAFLIQASYYRQVKLVYHLLIFAPPLTFLVIVYFSR